jgi:hypothetical protein
MYGDTAASFEFERGIIAASIAASYQSFFRIDDGFVGKCPFFFASTSSARQSSSPVINKGVRIQRSSEHME